jgi:malonyl CoA-acyl carrier protein transacylase
MNQTIGLFPGQGSQYVGMGARLAGKSPAAAEVFDRAEAASGVDVRRLCWETDSADLERTENAQLALTVFSLAAFSAYQCEGGATIDAFAGHSVGAIAAASAAGYLSVEQAVILARTRGRLMATAPGNGGMLAVAVPARSLEEEARKAGQEMAQAFGLDVAAHNGPRQIVLSGPETSLDQAAAALGAKAKRLSVSHAFHSRLMGPVEAEWHSVLDSVPMPASAGTFVGCTDAIPTTRGADVRADLKRGLCHPVLWSSVMDGARAYDRLCVFGSGRAIARLARPYLQSRDLLVVEDNLKIAEGAGNAQR